MRAIENDYTGHIPSVQNRGEQAEKVSALMKLRF